MKKTDDLQRDILMGPFLIAAIGAQYLAVAADQYLKGDAPHALMYFAYALANVGLWFASK